MAAKAIKTVGGKGKKTCPECGTIVGARAGLCPKCEYVFVPKTAKKATGTKGELSAAQLLAVKQTLDAAGGVKKFEAALATVAQLELAAGSLEAAKEAISLLGQVAGK